MEIRAGPVEQADDGRVDVPHLVSASRAQADLRFRRMHAEPGPPPAVLPDEAVPRGGRGPDLAEPLGEDRERAGRDVAIVGRRDQVLDCPDLEGRQSRRGSAGTGGLIIKHTGALPALSVKPTRRHAQEPEDRSQREVLAGPVHGAQDPQLSASLRETRSGETKSGGAKQGPARGGATP